MYGKHKPVVYEAWHFLVTQSKAKSHNFFANSVSFGCKLTSAKLTISKLFATHPFNLWMQCHVT